MILNLSVTGANEDELRDGLILQAKAYFGDKQFRLTDVRVNTLDLSEAVVYEANASAYPWIERAPAISVYTEDPFDPGW